MYESTCIRCKNKKQKQKQENLLSLIVRQCKNAVPEIDLTDWVRKNNNNNNNNKTATTQNHMLK